MHRVAVLLLLGALASGCSVPLRSQAPIERPALDVPPAPPRVIDPAPVPEVALLEPVSDLPPPPADPRPLRRSPKEDNSRDTQKPEPKPETPTETPPAADPAASSAAPAQSSPPVPVLRTPATADTAAADRRIRDILGRAQAVLRNVDYQKLNEQRKGAYDQAKSSIEEAETALKESNFELAGQMAEKADKLAKELQGR